ncbi:hypothetical protein FVE85_6836 [Porphyridium purpureum]|uniref:peptidylprolyl isomerase n=1 Tax=Porphyridium purpureum TaxID=35688 RepID=A0A5J4Z5W6_PORPP|nr:hypothetical protein FVE85_6836 [Porphyridium purpureum]|eukprot:POR5723..scf295_1
MSMAFVVHGVCVRANAPAPPRLARTGSVSVRKCSKAWLCMGDVSRRDALRSALLFGGAMGLGILAYGGGQVDTAHAAVMDSRRVDELFESRDRLLPLGKPEPTEAPPAFDPKKPIKTMLADEREPAEGPSNVIEYQDETAANAANGSSSEAAVRSSLVICNYKAISADGTVIDQEFTRRPYLFRVGSKQATPALDVGVMGMRAGDSRVLRGVALTMLSDIQAGERALIGNDEILYLFVTVKKVNPF